MKLEENIIDAAADEIAKDIDRGVMWLLLEDIGWTVVSLDGRLDNSYIPDISDWLKANCQEQYDSSGRNYLFESKQDAAMFALRWL